MANLSEFTTEAPIWVSGRTYTIGQVVRDPADWYFRYVRVAGGAGTTNPINDPGNWRPDGARPIKSIQRGIITIPNGTSTATATISAVNTAKSELRFLGSTGANGGSPTGFVTSRIQLTNSTTLTAESTAFAYGHALSWELTEYY